MLSHGAAVVAASDSNHYRKECSKPRSSSARSSATSTCRASPSRSSGDSTFPSPTPARPRRPQAQSLCSDHTGTVVTEVPRQTGQPRPPPEFPSWKAVGTTDSKRHRRLESSTRMEVVTMRARVGFVPCSTHEVDSERRSWCVAAPLGALTHCRAAPVGSRSEPSAGSCSESLSSDLSGGLSYGCRGSSTVRGGGCRGCRF